MPIFQFRCPQGHEFEKILSNKNELHKWCKHCDRLTIWIEVEETSIGKVCSVCMGSRYIAPSLERAGLFDAANKERQEPCPECGELAEHVVRIKVTGSHQGGPNNLDHSVRFHFDYSEPD